ncbi:podocalyxin isoform 2-T2 [Acridotheres tristis]
MRAAGLLPLLLLPLLLGVNSQVDADSADSGQNSVTTATTTTESPKTAESTTTTTPASTAKTSPATSASPPTTAQTTTTTEAGAAQPTVAATTATTESTTTTTTTQSTPTTQSSTTTTESTTTTDNPGTSPSSTANSATGTTLTAVGISPVTTSALTPVQDSSSHGPAAPKTTPAASSTTAQQPSSTAAISGSLGSTAAAQPVVTSTSSPPGAVGAVGTSSPGTQPQGSQSLDHVPNTTVSTTGLRTDPPQSSKECVVPLPQCPTKQSPSSSSSSVQGPTPSSTSGSTSTSVIPLAGSPSVTTTPMSQPGSKDTVPKAATTTAPGADQSTHDAGSAKSTSASQSPDSVQSLGPASGDQTDHTESCSSGHQQPNISDSNELICKDQVQHTTPIIHLKEPRTCDEWRTASKNISFFESFCSTAQRVFDASRDLCTVILMACKPSSHHWAVRVVLHFPLDSEEVLTDLKEKKDKLEELGIVNITSDKMVEDMTINDEFSTPLIITIITLAGSLLLIAAIYGCHQRFSQKKDQNIHPDVPGFDDGHVALIFNRLTEEMQTMENGYHDNPTLEVMETSSEMQEKKVNLNGELGDSWIVPLDTLMKEDLEEEEDTHL